MTDDQIIDRILAAEGGYVHHAADKGGPTNFGITLRTLAEWRGRATTAEDVQGVTVAEARDIYRTKYLQPFASVTQDLKAQVVDIAVNSGPGTARRLLEKALNQRKRPASTQLTIERLKHYAAIVHDRPSQAVFLEGWIARACDFL